MEIEIGTVTALWKQYLPTGSTRTAPYGALWLFGIDGDSLRSGALMEKHHFCQRYTEACNVTQESGWFLHLHNAANF